MSCRPAPVEIVLVYQSLLGIYGDRGNASVLVKRLQWRGFEPMLTAVEPGDPLPDTGEVYLLGGGEDAAQISAVRALRGRRRSVPRGRTAARPCSRSAPATRSSAARFTVGERRRGDRGPRAARRDHHPRTGARGRRDPHPLAWSRRRRRMLTGFENHGGYTRLGPSATPLADGGDRRRQRRRRHRGRRSPAR